MLTNYPGINPLTFSPFLPTGYGIWPTPQEDDGSGVRSAANIFAISEALTSRTNALGWRTFWEVNGQGSGTYRLLGNVALNTNLWAWTFSGTGNLNIACQWNVSHQGVILNNATLFVGAFVGAGHIEVTAFGDITVDADGTIFVNGTSGHPGLVEWKNHSLAQWDSGSVLSALAGSTVTLAGTNTLSGTTTQTGPYIKSGSDALTKLRTHTVNLSAAGASIADATFYDIVYVISGDDGMTTYPLDIAAPVGGTPLGVCFKVVMPGNSQVSGSFPHMELVVGTGITAITYDVTQADNAKPEWMEFMCAQDVNNGGALAWVLISNSFGLA